jgi:hypothetical protein
MAERSAKLTGAASKDVEARKTRMAAPVSFSRSLALEFLQASLGHFTDFFTAIKAEP